VDGFAIVQILLKFQVQLH
jgi:hypothetical protein